MRSNAIRAALTLLPLLACAACASTRPTLAVPRCEDLVPRSLLDPVPGAPLPDGTAPDWRAAFVVQSGQLDKANGRAPAVDTIYRDCLVRHRAAGKPR